jgi:hypothetical protein
MMKLTTPKTNKNLFYVTSEAKPNQKEASHIVVRMGYLFFCDCRDFMIRKLPVFGTKQFKLCKHGEFVRDVMGSMRPGQELVEAVRQWIS